MSRIAWTRRLAVTGCVAGIGLAVAGVGVADAQGESTTTPQPAPTTTIAPAPAPITISPAQVQRLCTKRVPKLEARATKLINRINGGADVRGSTQWLRARERQAQAHGLQARVKRLDARINRRTKLLGVLRGIRTKLHDFTTAHCGTGK